MVASSYLEEKVAVDEPSGVSKPDELHDLGKLQKSRTSLSSYTQERIQSDYWTTPNLSGSDAMITVA